MNNIEIVSLTSSIIAIICIILVGYFDYKAKLNEYLRKLAKEENVWNGVGFEYWIYIVLFCLVICINSFFFWHSVPSPCESKTEIVKRYLHNQLENLNK